MALLLAALVVLLLALPAAGDARSDGDLRSLGIDLGLLVLPITSNAELDSLEFYDPTRKIAIALDDVVKGPQLALLKVPTGSYFLRKVTLPNHLIVEYEAHDKYVPKFTVGAGAINYAGDLAVAATGRRVEVSFGGNATDALPTLLRRDRDIEQDLFARFPFVLSAPLDALALYGRAPDPGWRLADWYANLPALEPTAQQTLAQAVFARFGATLPALGASFAETRKALGALNKSRAHFDGIESDQRLMVHLGGWWGELGQEIAFELLFVDGKLAQAALRSYQDNHIWGAPRRDAREDLEALVAGR